MRRVESCFPTLFPCIFPVVLLLLAAPSSRAANFVIEAEDFNHGSGQRVAAADTMPYYGGAYAGLAATHLVDYYQVNDDPSSDLYRAGESPNVPTVDNADFSRGEWTVTTNYRIGWTEVGDWYNYTRNFPAGQYELLAALSYDGTAASQLKGALHQVTAGANTTSQTLVALGVFDAPGSGGWGLNALAQLQNGAGTPILLNLSGVTTLRYTAESGDIDYFLFRLIAPPQISQQPNDTLVSEGGTASFTVVVSNPTGCTYQWYRGTTLLSGATASTYALSPVATTDNGATFFCRITNPQGTIDTRAALLTVSNDTTPPTLVAVSNLGDPQTLSVLFSEPVDPATATATGNYALNNGASVTSAGFAGDTRTLVLKTTPLLTTVTYTLTVNNVRDRASVPNTIAPNSQRTFSLNFTPLDIAVLRGSPEPAGPSSRNTALVITEIHYNPAPRTDGRELEFIELYNSDDAAINLSGFRLTGEISYTFPTNTTLAARAYLAVAPVPADLQTVYGIANVVGGFTNRLANNGGTLRLRNKSGAILLAIDYNNTAPWPVAADNTGHTLTLARPSYGENDPRAWTASDLIGGTPGRAETPAANPQRTVLINEFLAHTDPPLQDYLELFNYSAAAVDLSGCILTDNPATNRFVIAAATSIPARGFLAFDQTQLGFALNTSGETIYLFNAAKTRVLDVIRFKDQENGVATGRFPDGAPTFRRLSSVTFGAANTGPRFSPVVFNELFFNPPGGDGDEFVELLNRTAAPIDLAGWRLEDAVEFTFPAGFTIPANGFAVIPRDSIQLLANHPTLNPARVPGNYQGSLSNGGERLTLTQPDTIIVTNNGVVVTNTIHIALDEVAYAEGGRWSRWSDGGGSSLELIDPESDHTLMANWADSDESAKSAWVTVEHTGVLDHGNGAINELQALLLGGGECLLDNLEVSSGGGNLVANGTFESGTTGWIIQGNHVQSGLSAPGLGDASTRALHLRASSGGDNGANRVETDLTSALAAGNTATLRGRARWLKGHPDLLLRLHGNHLEAVGSLPLPANLGTPGAPNSRALANRGPAIVDVAHSPVLPTTSQAVTVRARVDDPDGLASVTLTYRVDPATNLTTVAMSYNGAGFYSATLPGQAAGALVAFSIQATDAPTSGAASSSFPADAPTHECLVRWNDPTPAGGFGIYRLWLTQASTTTWSGREKLSNEALDGTFVYGNVRAIYNAGGRYRGSPFIRPGYNTPTGGRCAYVWTLPDDDLLLGADELNLDSLEPGDRDPTALREITSFWMADQLGVPFSHQRYVHVIINGVPNASRGIPIYTDTQQPDSSYVKSWFADDADGDIFKVDDWFEFNDAVGMEFNINATLENFTTTGGVKKQARYRWAWEKKFNGTLNDDYTPIFALADALNTPGAAYVPAVEAAIDVDNWIAEFALRHAVGDWDGYGYDRGKNTFSYKPQNAPWQLLLWDLDFSLGCNGGHGPTTDLFGANDPTISRLYNEPHFRRRFLQVLQRLAYGPMEATPSTAFIQAKYNSLVNNSVTTTSPFVGSGAQGISIPDWIAQRRAYIITQLSAANAAFAITSNSGNNFSTAQNLVTLTGTAPLDVHTIRINGVDHPVLWTALSTWSVQVALPAASNPLTVLGIDYYGNTVAGSSDTITVTYTGALDTPESALVINEIHYNPVAPQAGFVELRNRSTTTAFNLTNYRLNGIDFTFPPGTILPAGGYAVVVANVSAFVAAYGTTIPIAGAFTGGLDNGGETLQLLRPGSSPGTELLVDEVTYDDDAPWPALADGFGPSLQLIDGAQDNNRVANWGATTGTTGSGSQTLVPMTATWHYNQSGTDLGTTWKDSGYSDAAWPSGPALLYVESADLPAPKNTPLTIGPTTFYFRSMFTFTGNPAAVALQLSSLIDDGVAVYLNGVEVYRAGLNPGPVAAADFANRTVDNATLEGPVLIPSTSLVNGVNTLAAEVHQINAGSSDIVFGLELIAEETGVAPYTPGAANSLAATLPTLPPVWLNEVQIANATGPQDNAGERDPWVELHNAGATTQDLTGWYLSDSVSNLTRWPFPAGTTLNAGVFRTVWLDAQSGQTAGANLHASFRLSSTNTSVFLTRVSGSVTSIIDYLNAPVPVSDRSYGAYPDATPAKRRTFYFATPTAPNSIAWPATPVFINEGMAANATTLVDPVDGDFDDWFELYNDGPTALDLSGFTLTDNTNNPTLWTIPEGTTLPANGFLVVWADGETNQNLVAGLHASFNLSRNGETIALYSPSGTLINSLTLGIQTDDVTEGRWPDANTAIYTLSAATPGAPNEYGTVTNHAPTLTPIGNRAATEGSPFSLTAAATDPDAGQSLGFSLDAAPAGAVINPDSGVFTWTPTETQGPGSFPVTVRVTDDGTPALSDTETLTITVAEVNVAPTLTPITAKAVTEGVLLSFSANATDSDLPTQTLTYSLEPGAPAGASVDPVTGLFTFTPIEAQGPGSYSVTLVATDNGSPALNAAQTFSIDVSEFNSAPSLAAIGDRTVDEGAALSFTVTATDADLPAQTLTFSMDGGAPAGATFNPATRTFSWTPTEAQGPGTFTATLRVTDVASPTLTDFETVTITVREANTAPSLAAIGDRTADEGSVLSFTISATDADLPAQTLTYSMDAGAPAGAAFNPATRTFTWTPTEAQGPGTNTITLRVTDTASPALADFETTTLIVREANVAPSLAAIGDRTVGVGDPLTFTVSATDTDLPANPLTYTLDPGAPTGATLAPATGAFAWTPTGAQTGTNIIVVRVTDAGAPPLAGTRSFSVTVTAQTPLTVTEIRALGADQVVLTWSTQPGRSYGLEYKNALTDPTWTNAGQFPATANTLTATNTLTAQPQRYFRVLQLP